MTRAIGIRKDFSEESFAAFGAVITRPDIAGARQFYSDWLGGEGEMLTPVFHVNRMEPVAFPVSLDTLERHPHAAQAFVPLDVSRYLVTVAPTAENGAPDLARLVSFEVPGSVGVIYRRNVWHAGARVLDRTGAFAVLMWRGASDDDVFAPIEACQLVPLTAAQLKSKILS